MVSWLKFKWFQGQSPSQKTGHLAEKTAIEHIKKNGLKIVHSNLRTPYGEIDIIARDGDCLVFIEVKFRRNNQFGGAAYAIGQKKYTNLYKSIIWYTQKSKTYQNYNYRIDAIFLQNTTDHKNIEWLKNIYP